MFWLNIISKFIKAMRAGETPTQIAAGFSFGFLIGLMPFWTLQGVLLFFLLFLFNINLAAGTLAMLLCSALAYLFDPLFHSFGFFMLTGIPALQATWEAFYNLPAAPLSRFNNTVVMGSFVFGLVAVFPVFFGMKKFVVVYRAGVEERIKKWKIVQIFTGSKLFRWYEKIRDLGGA